MAVAVSMKGRRTAPSNVVALSALMALIQRTARLSRIGDSWWVRRCMGAVPHGGLAAPWYTVNV